MARAVSRAEIERERSRARGARRLLPWSVASAIAGGALGAAAGGGIRAAAVLAAAGLLFSLYLRVAATARCPACGAALPARGDPPEACPRCRVPFAP